MPSSHPCDHRQSTPPVLAVSGGLAAPMTCAGVVLSFVNVAVPSTPFRGQVTRDASSQLAEEFPDVTTQVAMYRKITPALALRPVTVVATY